MSAAAALLVVAALAVGASALRSRGSDATGPGVVPVVVIPGYGGDERSVAQLVAALAALGRPVVVVPGANAGRGSILDSARLLTRAIDRLDAPLVDLVGYSAGGVVVRYWAADRDTGAKARRIVTLGSPHHGTTLAAAASLLSPDDCTAGCADLRPDSAVLRALNETDETPGPAAWTSIWTADDETVVPPSSAVLNGATNVRLQDLCPGARVSHSGLVSAPLPLRLTVQVVDTGSAKGAAC